MLVHIFGIEFQMIIGLLVWHDGQQLFIVFDYGFTYISMLQNIIILYFVTLFSCLNQCFMMTSSNGNLFRVTGHLCGEFTGPGEFPAQRPVTRSFDVFFDLPLNKRLSKQSWGWWFETLSWPLWRHRNVIFPSTLVFSFHIDTVLTPSI